MIYIKIAIALIMMGGAWGLYYLIGENAILKANAEHDRMEIEGYRAATLVLSEKFQLADKVEADEYKKISQADFDQMAKRHPDMLERRINAGTARMLDDLSQITQPPRASEAEATDSPPG